MKYPWVRMYPNWRRPGASYVVDKLAKWEVVEDCYGDAMADVFRTVVGSGLGYVNVEWDTAVDPADIAAVEACIDQQPNVIWVAAYLGYGSDGQQASTALGLGCTWLPRMIYDRFDGLRTVRYPSMDGEIMNFASRNGIEIRQVAEARVKHLHW